ncbi:hypothetical protein FRB99_002374 [Tulasnella sp. 403]|nr:hypothetical protein FRB99_002374 [Tulasnella sp. 403]
MVSPVPTVGTPRLSVTSSEDGQWASQHAQNAMEEPALRQWTFTAFEWTIKDVAALRDYLEQTDGQSGSADRVNASGADDDRIPYILKQSPMIGGNGENKFKVEIGRSTVAQERSMTPTGSPSPTPRSSSSASRVSTLSLYVIALFIDFAHPEYEFLSANMVGIKSPENRAGDRGARSDWVWEFWEHDFSFRSGNEFWECQLPSLSTLLSHPRIAAEDSFVLCMQIHSPTGFYPQFPHAFYVPRDLLAGLEASLDNPYTGDVRFVVLEWYDPLHSEHSDPSAATLAPPSPSGNARSSATTLARKRTLYAHSDILKRRSEYFATMLASAFAESMPSTYIGHHDGLHPRKIYNITVSEADFVTIYWLLKWVYADWILFRSEDDPRAVMNGLGGGWSVNSLTPSTGLPGQAEWDWRSLKGSRRRSSGEASGHESETAENHDWEDESHTRSVRSASSIGTSATHPDGTKPDGSGKDKGQAYANHGPGPSRGGSSPSARGARTNVTTSRTASASLSPSARRTNPPSPNKPPNISVPPSGRPSVANPRTRADAPASSSYANVPPSASAASRSSVSPHQSRYPPLTGPGVSLPAPDPHQHPTPELPAASALAIYQIAHRYSLPGLQSLALEHMMSTITPKSSFPLLLATHFWEELHILVEDFIVDHFELVSRCENFDQCCEEVANGEWGPEGGRTLAALFRRLASPQSVRYRA